MAQLPRPKLISITTALAIVFVLSSFPILFMPSIKKIGDFIPMLLGLIITLQFISLIGVWHMKRWGVELFIIVFFIRLLTFLILGLQDFRLYFNITYSVIAIGCFMLYYKKMSHNL